MHIGCVIRDLDRRSGGPSRSVPALCHALVHTSAVQATSLCFSRSEDVVTLPDAKELYLVDFQDGMDRTLANVHQHRPFDFLHVHGIWTWSLHQALRFARRHGIAYAVSPRGMLSNWCLAHKRWKKRLAYWIYQKRDLQRATFIHATSADEGRDVRRLLGSSRIVEIPNGCEIPPMGTLPAPNPQRVALTLCRLHPVKQLDLLIQLWARLPTSHWKLKIVGPGEKSYRDYLVKLARELGVDGRVDILPEVGDVEKWQMLGDASLFILPSLSENFGMSIAEALAAGTPVACTSGTPWGDIVHRNCGWVSDVSAESIENMLQIAISYPPEELSSMGGNGRALIQERYSWESVAGRMADEYTKKR